MGFPYSSVGKESACNAGDPGSVPGSGRSPGEGNGNPLQDYCLETPMDRGAWQATGHGVAESDTTERTSLSVYIRDLSSLTSSGWSGGRGDRGELFSIFYSYDNIQSLKMMSMEVQITLIKVIWWRLCH